MKRVILILIAALVLAGCSREIRQQMAQANREAEERRMANIKAQCSNYGFTQGNPEYANCVMQIDLADKSQRNANDQQSRAETAAAFRKIFQVTPVPVPKTTQCNPDGFGGMNCTTQ